jgi:hypothetical protein
VTKAGVHPEQKWEDAQRFALVALGRSKLTTCKSTSVRVAALQP